MSFTITQITLCRLNFVSHPLSLIHSSTKCGHSTLIKNIMTMVSCRGHERKDRMVGWMHKWMKALPHRLLRSHDCSGSKHHRTAAGGGGQRSEESFNYGHHTHTTNTCKRAKTPEVHFPCPLFNTRWQYYTSLLCGSAFSISGHRASSCGQRYFCSITKHSITIINIILGCVCLIMLPGYSGSHSRPGLCVRSDDVPGRASHT